MSRAAQNEATKTYNTSSALENASDAKTSALYNQLTPTYTQEATNPQGFGSANLAAMNTASQQSAGGAEGAAVGQAGRMAAANRNSGSFAPVLDEASRDAGRTLSSNALGVQGMNANLKETQRQSGLQGLQGLENQQNNDVLSSLGLQNQSTNTLVNAGNSGWFQNMTGLMNAAGKGAGSMVLGFNQGGGAAQDDESAQDYD